MNKKGLLEKKWWLWAAVIAVTVIVGKAIQVWTGNDLAGLFALLIIIVSSGICIWWYTTSEKKEK